MTDVLSNQNIENLVNEAQVDNLLAKHYSSRKSISLIREDAEALNRKIPMELLAMEWFTKLDSSAETKAYLLENFLPILVLGCEKVLKEAQKRNLINKKEKDPNFNPINRLAKFLMRNNPSHNNHNETSPYVRTTREVFMELRDQLFILQGNKLAKAKEDVRKRRAEREQQEKLQSLEISKRRSQIESLFDKFNIPQNGRLELSILVECLNFYKKYLSTLPNNQRKKLDIKPSFPPFCYNRNDLNLKKRLMKNDFIETLMFITEDLENENFDLFNDFIEECSVYFVNLANSNNFGQILHNLVIMLDSTSTGLLSRRRIIRLLNEFREKDSNAQLRNPLEWPVLDPFIKFENKLEQLIPEKKMSENFSKAFLMSEVSMNQIPEKESIPKMNEDNTDIQENPENQPAEAEKSMVLTEKTEGTLVGEEKSGDLNVTEKSAEANVEDTIEPNQQIDLQKSFQKEVSIVNDLKPQSSNLNEIIQSTLSREEELLFMKGGMLYYVPINKTFNIDLLKDLPDDLLNNMELLYKFDPEFLNSKQFRNLINTFVTQNFINSEIYVNDLIVFLKDNYAESRFEKNSKQDKNRKIKQDHYRNKKYSACFDKLDNEGSGQLNLTTIESALQDFKDGLFKEQIANSINLTRSETSVNGKSDDTINKNEFFDLISVLVGLVDFPKFEDQLLNYLSCLYTFDATEKTRGEVRKKWLNQIRYVGDITCGSFEPLFKQLFFTLFKDAENHGMKNNISAYIGILENLEDNTIGLRYHASTPHDSKFVLGKTLSKNDKCLSFDVIDSGNPRHIENLKHSENVHFFNPSSSKSDASFVIFPLKYARNKVFGTIGIDTIQNTNKNSSFSEHELAFYQGLANSFANAYAHIIFKNRMIKTCLSTIEWIKSRCQGIDFINVYFVQLLENEANLISSEEHNLSLMNEKFSVTLKPIIKYSKKDGKMINILNDMGHLTEEVLEKKHGSKAYQCAVVSESTVEYFNGKASYYVPLRNEEHKTVLVLEITSEEYYKFADKNQAEMNLIERVLYILHKCQEELLEAHFLGIVNNRYEYENLHEQDKFDILFEKCYINFICEKLREYLDNPITEAEVSEDVKQIFKLVSDLTDNDEFNEKHVIDENLVNKLHLLDPTAKEFKFPSSVLNLASHDSIKKLHDIYKSTDESMFLVKLLIDYACLLSDLKIKTKS